MNCMKTIYKNPKKINILLSISTIMIVTLAIILEKYLALKPCTLCMLQRATFVMIGLCFLLSAFLVNRKKAYYFIFGINTFFILLGVAISIRLIYLQYFPDPFETCGASLDFVLKHYPILEILEFVLKGSSNCQKEQIAILGIQLPWWSMIMFVGYLVMNILVLLNIKKR